MVDILSKDNNGIFISKTSHDMLKLNEQYPSKFVTKAENQKKKIIVYLKLFQLKYKILLNGDFTLTYFLNVMYIVQKSIILK